MNSINVDEVVRHVKTLADINRCVGCDGLKDSRVRYPCGHPICSECVQTADNCLLCLSPPNQSSHVDDGPLSLRVEHASNLLKTFQELFKLDVYMRQRVSDQLLKERELFPECIQAPSKYCNSKRKSNISIENKENLDPVLPGERTSRKSFLPMENKMSYVKQWLSKNQTEHKDQHLPRKPFTDLNVNHPNISRPKPINRVAKSKKIPKKNKSHLKILDSEVKQKPLKKCNKTKRKSIRMKLEQTIVKYKKGKCENNESGIFIDDDIEIIDTPSVDKDKDAWLAVLRAEQQEPCEDSISKLSKSELDNDVNDVKNQVEKSVQCQNVAACKVPFYKRSSLVPIKIFNENTLKNKTIQDPGKPHNFTFTIDSSNYITTVEFYEDQDDYNKRSKYSVMSDNGHDNLPYNSVAVQTENGLDNVSKFAESKLSVNNGNFEENNHIPTLISKNHDAESDLSPVLSKGNAAIETNQNEVPRAGKEYKCMVVDDSDTDSENLLTGRDSLIEVTAEVHRSETENDRNALSQLESGQYENRMKRAARGHTPNSSDSSDKENCDPNRAKRPKLDKKCCTKNIRYKIM